MTSCSNRLRKIWDYGSGRTTLAAVCAHSVSISIGICQGYSAILIPQLDESHTFSVDSDQSSWLASLGAVTNPIGSILSGLLAEWLGRRQAIQISSAPFIVGWLCIAFARDIWWLYTGRLITGIAAGMATASYTYVSEISTPEQRGIYQALGPVSASFGILFTYTLGFVLSWNHVALISLSFAILTVLGIHFMPESPSYLFKKQRRKEAFDSLVWLRRSNALAQAEYQKHVTEVEAESGIGTYITSSVSKPFVILTTFFVLQELSGIYCVLFYAVNFFREAEVDVNEYISSIIVGVIRFLMSIISAFLINRYRRRTLSMFSSAGMGFSLAVIIGYLKYYDFNPTQNKALPLLPLACILLNVLFSMIGMLPIPWILVGELFPLQVRSIMCGIVICIAQTFIFVSVKIYPDMMATLGFSGTLMVFASASFLALAFSKFCLPETKNRSLEEIEEFFKEKQRDKFGVENPAYNSSPVKAKIYTIKMCEA